MSKPDLPTHSGRPTQALILFAHGARDPSWAAPFEAMAALVRARQPAVRVALAFLELMEPGLEAVVGAMAQDAVTEIAIVPVFMAAGGHLKRDLPVLVEKARAAHPGVTLRLHPPVGENLAVQAAIAQACAQALVSG